MSKQPIISVIMPCYNEAERLTLSIKQVFQQSFTDFELIVVDDGSTDNSLELLSQLSNKYPLLKYFSQANRGCAASPRNHGLKKAGGEYIAFLDADDSWHPDFLLKLYNKLISSPDKVLAYCGWQNIGLKENQCKPFVPPNYEHSNKIEALLLSCPWPIHAALTKCSAIKNAGGFDEEYITSEDFDLWLRIASFAPIILVPEVLAFYHHRLDGQVTNNRLRIALNHFRVQLKYLKENPEMVEKIGSKKIKTITYGELLHRGYSSYWDRDLTAARIIFKTVMKSGYGSISDWKYMLPSLLPEVTHKKLIEFLEKN